MMHDKPYLRVIRLGFIALAWLFAIAVVLQVFIAGLALFVTPAAWMTHVGFARFFAFLPLVMTVLAWSGRLPGRMIRRSAGLFGMIVGMFVTAVLSSRIGFLSALHPVIALMLFWSCAELIRSYRRAIQ